jgi:SAM-dependent methyltransferase
MSYLSYKDKSRIAKLNISYYDEIANSYDEILNQEDSNKIVRQQVEKKVASLLRPGQTVLDFGGGTGLDLEWLLANDFKILFCEPSDVMRQLAIRHHANSSYGRNIIFLDRSKTDFSTWHVDPPFTQQVDGILSDFGVINCIPDIGFLFKSLALVIKPGGHLVAVFLDRPLRKMWSWHRRNTIRSLLFDTPFVMFVRHKDHQQMVFVHSVKEIKQAASGFFDYISHEKLTESGFILIHLVRK